MRTSLRLFVPATVLASALAPSGPVWAETGGHHLFEVGLSSGAFLPSSQHELYASTQTFHAPFKTAGLDLQLHLAIFPVSFAGLEVEGGYIPIQTLGGRSTTVLAGRGHFVLQVPGRFSPFLLAGAGVLGVQSSVDALGNDVDRAFHWGGGVKLYVTDHVALRLDARDVLSAGFGPSAGNVHHLEAFAGISIGLAEIFPSAPVVAREISKPVEADPTPEPVITERVVASTPLSLPEDIVGDCTRAANNPRCKPEEVVKAELDRVHFAWGSSDLATSDHPALDNAAELLAAHPDLEVEIDGHTDSTGPQSYNMILSMRRAEAVKAYLVDKGIAAERLTVRGHGPFEPIDSNATKWGRAMNRRGEIKVQDRRTKPTEE